MRNTNSFDFLRFIAAMMVVFYHSYQLTGNDSTEPLHILIGSLDFGTLGVYVFFIISGYLITQSWLSTSTVERYFWKRCLRIFPGLFLMTLITVLIIGPVFTKVSLIDYFTNWQTYVFLFGSITLYPAAMTRMTLPGVFTDNVVNKVNGSLWTIPYEFTMYILIAGTGIIGILKRRSILLIGLLVAIVVYVMASLSMITLPLQTITILFLGLFILFFMGSAFYVYREKLKYDYRVAALLLVIGLLSVNTVFFICFIGLWLPYVVLTIAHLPIKIFNNFGKYGDFSYGVYIYGFPIQQVLAQNFGNTITVPVFFLISMVLVVPCAYISWHLVESKALKLKNINPSKYFLKRY